jgi:arylsulfatase
MSKELGQEGAKGNVPLNRRNIFLDRQIQGQVRPRLGQGARGNVRAAEAARRHPPECELTKRPEEIPAWDKMDAKLYPVLAREMEIYAAYLEIADYHTGHVIDSLNDLGILDDTLIYYIIGDNGASAEGSLIGSLNEQAIGEAPDLITPNFLIQHIDDLGTPWAYNHYAVGWAHAMDTPYQWTKQVASHFGGTRNGLIVHWPRGIKTKGEFRSQFHHVIDVAPTVLEAAKLPQPTIVDGVMQEPMHGVSMLYSFDDRGIYHKGWTAVTRPGLLPCQVTGAQPSLNHDVCELYDTNKDWSQAHDLAKQMPEKLAELKRQFELEAVKYNVFPLDDRKAERANPDMAGRIPLSPMPMAHSTFTSGRTRPAMREGYRLHQRNTYGELREWRD